MFFARLSTATSEMALRPPRCIFSFVSRALTSRLVLPTSSRMALRPPRFFLSRALSYALDVDTSGEPLTYALDTNVSSYIMNGELWQRSPLDLLIHLNANNLLKEVGSLERLSSTNTIQRFMAVYEWAKPLKGRLFLPPTVVDELTLSKQVGVNYYVV